MLYLCQFGQSLAIAFFRRIIYNPGDLENKVNATKI